ncbi:MAG: serine protease [Bacteroidetes bacterium]|nr:serine protease [Bacteroidota bacterium]
MKAIKIIVFVSTSCILYCQFNQQIDSKNIFDQTLSPSGNLRKSTQTEHMIIKSAQFITDFNSSINIIKNNRELGYKGKQLKGITTRQISGASKLYKKCAPGVVLLISLDATSLGSGSIVDKEGNIITNWHVVVGFEQMLVWFHDPEITNLKELDPENYSVADVVAIDPKRDLAMLKITGDMKNISSLELGKHYQLDIAQDVFAIGHPELFIWSFTYGVISQLRNNYTWSYENGTSFTANVIQTQTPTNPGNSGGPLFSDKGQLIGINSFGSEGQGLNFAVKVDEVKNFIKEIKAGMHKPESVLEVVDNKELDWEPVDMNENGITDSYRLSSKDDNFYDIAQIDENEDGVIDYIIFDTNRDSEIDVIVYDNDGNGTFEYFEIDEDYDGLPDTTGIDTDGDAIPDVFFAYSGNK